MYLNINYDAMMMRAIDNTSIIFLAINNESTIVKHIHTHTHTTDYVCIYAYMLANIDNNNPFDLISNGFYGIHRSVFIFNMQINLN